MKMNAHFDCEIHSWWEGWDLFLWTDFPRSANFQEIPLSATIHTFSKLKLRPSRYSRTEIRENRSSLFVTNWCSRIHIPSFFPICPVYPLSQALQPIRWTTLVGSTVIQPQQCITYDNCALKKWARSTSNGSNATKLQTTTHSGEEASRPSLIAQWPSVSARLQINLLKICRGKSYSTYSNTEHPFG